MRHKKLVVFDIETVPDSRLGAAKDFPPPAFHQVVAIAFLEADIVRNGDVETYVVRDLRAGGEPTYSEAALLRAFLQYVERLRPRIVSYNGRGFDIPVVKYRAMAHCMIASLFYEPDYSYRYNLESHCDLLELLSDFGASTRMRLLDVCTAFDLPAKLGMDGSDIHRLFQSGEIGSIRNYCEIDVISTYLIYLRCALSRGRMTDEGYELAMHDLQRYLHSRKQDQPHFAEFLREWERLSRLFKNRQNVHTT